MNRRLYTNSAVGILFCTFALTIIYTAWFCDDAFITFRTIDNYMNGFGLRWNIAERVQTYTHPLWMLGILAAASLSGDILYTVAGISICVSLLAVGAAIQAMPRPSQKMLFIVLCVSSNAFIDFSTSGLENPMTHLLLGLFFCFYLGTTKSKNIFFASVLCSLSMLNRIDTGLILLPALLYMAWQVTPRSKSLSALVSGFAPLIAWELFSLFYYGFLFPNTAYAKLNTGMPSSELWRQGATYLLHSLKGDPATIIVILSGVIAGCIQPCRRTFFAILGVCLYLIYVISIGGCHMAGRFLSAPFYVSALILTFRLTSNKTAIAAAALAVLCASGSLLSDYSSARIINRIGNERSRYQTHTNFLNNIRRNVLLSSELVNMGLQARKHAIKNGAFVALEHRMGLFPYFAGPDVHVVDYMGLADPFTARLPPNRDMQKIWRPGHTQRYIPNGYLETLATGIPHIEDHNLAAYYKKLQFIVRGNLFSLGRFKVLLLFNLGSYDHLINDSYWRSPPETKIILEGTDGPRDAIKASQKLHLLTPYYSGLRIYLGKIVHASSIDISLTSHDWHKIEFIHGGKTVYQKIYFPLACMPHEFDKLSVYRISLPRTAWEEGYDTIHVSSADDGHYGFGTIVLPD